jgi:hypothetical protein
MFYVFDVVLGKGSVEFRVGYVRHEILKAMKIEIVAFCVMKPCSDVVRLG